MSGAADYMAREDAAGPCQICIVRFRAVRYTGAMPARLSRPPAALLAAAGLAIAGISIVAQAGAGASVRTWVGNETRIEAHLKSAKVTRLQDIGTGVTKPRRAYLDPAEPVSSLVWKVLPPERRDGYWESYKSEIAAYELDKFLGMHVVPPAVERTIEGETGAAIMWLEGIQSVKQTGGKVPSGPIWGRAIRRMIMFDDLICNRDRNAGNILIGRPGELVLIDHSRAFIDDKDLPREIERVDAELWDRMTALTRDDLTRVVGAWIDGRAIAAMIARRDRMMKDVDKLAAKKGRALVIIR